MSQYEKKSVLGSKKYDMCMFFKKWDVRGREYVSTCIDSPEKNDSS